MDTNGLGIRARKALFNFGVESKERARELMESGELQRAREFGLKSQAEVLIWLGMPLPVKPIKRDRRAESLKAKIERREEFRRKRRERIKATWGD